MKKPRYYTALMRKEGKYYDFKFEADNLTLAWDHANHCAAVNGYEFRNVRVIASHDAPVLGVYEPHSNL